MIRIFERTPTDAGFGIAGAKLALSVDSAFVTSRKRQESARKADRKKDTVIVVCAPKLTAYSNPFPFWVINGRFTAQPVARVSTTILRSQ
jgi:hypothetical protein